MKVPLSSRRHQLFVIVAVLAITLISGSVTHAWRSYLTSTTSTARRHLLFRQSKQQRQQNTYRQQNRQKQIFRLDLRGGGGGEEDDTITTTKDVVVVTPHVEEPDIWAVLPNRKAIICMDIFSDYHGLFLAHRAKTIYGAAIIVVFSDYMKGYFQKHDPEQYKELSTMFIPKSETQIKDWRKSLPKDLNVMGILCESDSGLADAEQFGVGLNLDRHNGINEARRNKYLMIEEVGKAGLPVVKQKLCKDIEEAREFAIEIMGLHDSHQAKEKDDNASSTSDGREQQQQQQRQTRRRIVVKPIRGVASDDVYLCEDIASVEKACRKIIGSPKFSTPWENHDSVLVQECAEGQEYAIDIVSKDGQHKVAAIWKYDKRPANGASFVYFATQIYDDDDELSPVICSYAKHCLDALGIRWGITHNEVIITDDDKTPRLVEVNCRQHNMDFLPLTMGTIGYNAFDMLLSAYLGGEDDGSLYPPGTESERLDWDTLPDIPSKRMNGCMVHLVNYKEGKLVSINEQALMEIQSMPSVLDLEVYENFLNIGNQITRTIDIRSDAGWVQMLNPDQEEFERDYERIIELMPLLFEVE